MSQMARLVQACNDAGISQEELSQFMATCQGAGVELVDTESRARLQLDEPVAAISRAVKGAKDLYVIDLGPFGFVACHRPPNCAPTYFALSQRPDPEVDRSQAGEAAE